MASNHTWILSSLMALAVLVGSLALTTLWLTI